jgi:hypothetical protein
MWKAIHRDPRIQASQEFDAFGQSFLPEVRECITRHTAYNKHDTGWAKGAPSEDHTTPPSSRTVPGPLAAVGFFWAKGQPCRVPILTLAAKLTRGGQPLVGTCC